MYESQVLVVPDSPPDRHPAARGPAGGADCREAPVNASLKQPDPVLAEPEHSVSRPHGAPAYYQGRPASLWIKVMKPRHRRNVIDSKTPEPNDIEQSLGAVFSGALPLPAVLAARPPGRPGHHRDGRP
jgi:hypothetical protein